MSNEEIVALVQAGEQGLMGTLWEQVEGLVKWKANRVVTALDGRCGVEFGDLYNSGYPALVEAVVGYRPESGAFSTWFMYHLKTAFAEVTGYRTKAGREDPLKNALSLDKPVDEEGNGASFGDLVPDPKAAATIDSVEETIYRQQLHEAMEEVLNELPREQAIVLRHRYYAMRSLAAAGRELGVSAEEVRKLEG